MYIYSIGPRISASLPSTYQMLLKLEEVLTETMLHSFFLDTV